MTVEQAQTFSADDYSLASLQSKKGSTTVSVCIPARNEESTIAAIVDSVIAHFGPHVDEKQPLVDEVLVIDDRSTDETAARATSAGARVISVNSVLPQSGVGSGKGNVLWKSVAACTGDIIVWVDADLRSFTPSYILGLLGPLLNDPQVALVKGFYERPEQNGSGGGRTTELMARPLLSTFFPELGSIHQPLSGEYASRRSILEQVPFSQGYGVEVGLLIDVARLVGVHRIAQVDLGVRIHRNRPLKALSPQAMEVLHAVLRRADSVNTDGLGRSLIRPDGPPVAVHTDERPSLLSTPGYRHTGGA